MMILGERYDLMLTKDHTKLADVVGILFAALVPCFALSVFLEGNYLRRRVRDVNERSFWFAVMRAHCYSYLALLVLYCSWISFRIS